MTNLPTQPYSREPEVWEFHLVKLVRRGFRPDLIAALRDSADPRLLSELWQVSESPTKVAAVNLLWDIQDQTLVGRARILSRAARQAIGAVRVAISPPFTWLAGRLGRLRG